MKGIDVQQFFFGGIFIVDIFFIKSFTIKNLKRLFLSWQTLALVIDDIPVTVYLAIVSVRESLTLSRRTLVINDSPINLQKKKTFRILEEHFPIYRVIFKQKQSWFFTLIQIYNIINDIFIYFKACTNKFFCFS